MGRRKVTVFEKLSEVGRDMEAYNKRVLMGRLNKNGVEIVTRVTIKKVKEGKLFIRRNGNKRTIAFDGPLINATGTEANKEVFKFLRKDGELRNLGVYEIGDCVSPRRLRDAIFEGYMTSKNI